MVGRPAQHHEHETGQEATQCCLWRHAPGMRGAHRNKRVKEELVETQAEPEQVFAQRQEPDDSHHEATGHCESCPPPAQREQSQTT
jgi:hypothetical protein